MYKPFWVLPALLLLGCEQGPPAQTPEMAPAPTTAAPEGVIVNADTAWVPGYATTYIDSAGLLRADPGEADSVIAEWLGRNGFAYAGFEVDTVTTDEMRKMGLVAEDSTRAAVYGAAVYRR